MLKMKNRVLFSVTVLCSSFVVMPAWSQTQSACPPELGGTAALKQPLDNCFSELVRRIQDLEKAAKAAELPVGTILASYLQPVQFAQAIGVDGCLNPRIFSGMT
jgi:hypothetical protein